MSADLTFTLSFEFFPPKSVEGLHHLQNSATLFKKYSPDFFSVTFGAGGSTRAGTLETAQLLQKKTGASIAPHLSSVGLSCLEISEVLQTYQSIGVKQIVAIRGDLPADKNQKGELQFANELVELIRQTTGDYFHIYVAAYPECHPQAFNTLYDLDNLKRKIDAGANSAITQYFFNLDAYFYFQDECERNNISIPIIAGIMPITHFEKLMRFSDSCGAEIPRWLRKRLESYKDDPASIQAFGVDVISNLCNNLIYNDAPGLHFYTLNQAETTILLLERLEIPSQRMPLYA